MNRRISFSPTMLLCLTVIFTFAGCTPMFTKHIKETKINGTFTKTKNEAITEEYKIKVEDGFSASIDFEIKEGRVDWEIVSPKGDIVFSGYVVNEDGSTFRQLTEPSTYFQGRFSKKEVEKTETDSNGNVINIPDFPYLQFEYNSPSGIYKLNLKPTNCEGSYKAVWHDRLPSK